MKVYYNTNETLSIEEYKDFLVRTDLGSQYPKENFDERISKLLKNSSLRITARNSKGKLIGICFGLTDFSYFLFISDLGVDRKFIKKGIGSQLVQLIIDKAGGPDSITVITVSNKDAIGFYKKQNLFQDDCVLWKPCNVWTEFTVS